MDARRADGEAGGEGVFVTMGKKSLYEKARLKRSLEEITIPHRALLAPRQHLQYILDAVGKIRDNADELRRRTRR